MMITAAQFSRFFVIAPSVNPIEDTVFQDRKVRIRFYAHNNWNHHLVTASQSMVESRKQSLGPQARPGADTGHCGGPPQTDSLLYPLGLCLPLFPCFLLSVLQLFSIGPSTEAAGRQIYRTDLI